MLRKITAYPSAAAKLAGAKTFVIGDDTLDRGAGMKWIVALDVALDAGIEEGEFLRADGITHFDRMNERCEIRAVVQYRFESEDDSFQFVTDLQRTCPRIATVKIECGNYVRWLADAALRPIPTAEAYGTVATLVFTIRGGQILLKSPLPTTATT
jgi:hypothetical protein